MHLGIEEKRGHRTSQNGRKNKTQQDIYATRQEALHEQTHTLRKYNPEKEEQKRRQQKLDTSETLWGGNWICGKMGKKWKYAEPECNKTGNAQKQILKHRAHAHQEKHIKNTHRGLKCPYCGNGMGI